MIALLVYSVALIIGILFSERAERTVLSTSVLFLLVGAVMGSESLGVLALDAGDPLIGILAELALFSVLFTDGMKIGIRDLSRGFHQPGRALLLGLPLTLLGTAVLAHAMLDLPWRESLLLGAILSPTDPVLVSAIVGNTRVPQSLRHLLNVESGLNDGLALPVVILLIRILQGTPLQLWSFAFEIGGGIALGAAVPWLIVKAERSRYFGASQRYTALVPFASGILVFSLCSVLHANEYLAAFSAGVAIASISEDMLQECASFLEPFTELLKLAALFVFGALFSVSFLAEVSPGGYAFAVAALIVVRPLALLIALVADPSRGTSSLPLPGLDRKVSPPSFTLCSSCEVASNAEMHFFISPPS